MDPATLTTSTFSVTDAANNTVSGAVSYAGTIATFTPATNLAVNSSYTATITTGAKDATGQALAANHIWAFTTSSIASVAAGAYHTVALKSNGTVWAWGRNDSGQLGDGTTANNLTPVQTTGLTNVTAIAAGAYHTVALKSNGTVWTWGNNTYGQLGDGTTANNPTPVQTTGPTNVTAIAAGAYHTVALKSDGTVWTWGLNSSGQLGDGTSTDRWSPVQVTSLTGVVFTIASGGRHTIAFKRLDGTVWTWGDNLYGQLGDGTTINKSTPVQVTSLTGNITSISGGDAHTITLKSDGTVWTWGLNSSGQLGDGTIIDRTSPVQVTSLTGVVTTVAGGGFHTVIRKDIGTIWAWGLNSSGQLGDGTTANNPTPVQTTGLTGVTTSIAGGGYHNIVISNDGTVWTWGDNSSGQLGDGTTVNRSTPVQVKGL